MDTCEICKDLYGMPAEIHDMPVIICVKCLRRARLTKTGTLEEQVKTWMWKRKVLRYLKVPLNPDRLFARTQWLLAKRKLEEAEKARKDNLEAKFILSANQQLQNLLGQVSRNER